MTDRISPPDQPATESEPCSGPGPAIDALNAALAEYTDRPESTAIRDQLRATAARLATHVLALAKRDIDSPCVERALQGAVQLTSSGVQDYPVAPEHRALVASAPRKSWQQLIAMMLTGSAWQWHDGPSFAEVPTWLWGAYGGWVFAPPIGFIGVGDAERYAAFVLPRLEELARLLERNSGSAAVRAVGNAFCRAGSAIPLYFSTESLVRHAELRGRILKKLLAGQTMWFDPPLFPRAGRRLRIGFLSHHFGPQTETYTTLPTFAHLDHARFEVLLFSLRPADTPLAEYCRSRVHEFRVLPPEPQDQLTLLRDANLDVLVFGTNLTAVANVPLRLALHRIAPLQVVNNSSCITTGLPTIDLYVSGDQVAVAGSANQFSERLGLLRGPAHAFHYQADKQDPAVTFSRESLGLPPDAVVFVTAANYFKIIPEIQHAWARLLAAIPRAFLLVHPFNPNWASSYPIKRFNAEFDAVLAAHGVAGDRLLISTAKFPSRSDVKELLRVGDVYLDTFPFGGVNSLVDPLELGLPVVAWQGESFRSRMGAALLRALGLEELIADDEAAYREIAVHLATDAEFRAAISGRITRAMATAPAFLDPLAASDGFGALVESAFDELVQKGREAFKAERQPIGAEPALDRADLLTTAAVMADVGADDEAVQLARRLLAADPRDLDARHLLGKILSRQGRHAEATEYLIAVVESGRASGRMWRDLAVALKAAGNRQGFLQALETALRTDPRDVEGWFMLAEAAEASGNREMLGEVSGVLVNLAPDDPRTQVLLASGTGAAIAR